MDEHATSGEYADQRGTSITWQGGKDNENKEILGGHVRMQMFKA